MDAMQRNVKLNYTYRRSDPYSLLLSWQIAVGVEASSKEATPISSLLTALLRAIHIRRHRRRQRRFDAQLYGCVDWWMIKRDVAIIDNNE